MSGNIIETAVIRAATIGANVGRKGGAKAPKPEDCMKDCIAWYSPKRQGITNEYLQDHYLDDDAVLQDLSGNGNNIALHNMEGEEGGGYVNDDGDLVFDGVDDYGLIDGFTLGNSAIAVKAELTNGVSGVNINRTICDIVKKNSLTTHYFAIRTYGLAKYLDYMVVNSCVWGRKDETTSDVVAIFNNYDGEQVSLLAQSNIILAKVGGNDTTQAQVRLFDKTKINNDYLSIGCEYQHKHYTDMIFCELLFFRRNLTHEEAQWVYDNILTTDTNNQNS